MRSIAEALNARKVPAPRAQQGRPNGWSQSSVRDVLNRPLYRGEVVWGQTSCKYGRELPRGDTREMGQLKQPEDTWVKRQMDEYRLVDVALAARVDARRADKRSRYFKSLPKPGSRMPERTHGKYLLTGGMLLCPTCGGHFEAIKYPIPAYVCATRRRKPGCCPNTLTLPMAEADDAVLNMLDEYVLGQSFIDELMALVDTRPVEDTSRLAADVARLRAEVKNLLQAIAAGVPPETIAPEVRARETEISRLEARLRAPAPVVPRVEDLRAALEQRAADWRATLRQEPTVARVLVRRLITPLELYDASRPEWQMPDFIQADAQAKDWNTDVASPTGFEPVFWP